MDASLIALLVCPESRERLVLGDDALVARLNTAIDKGTLHNRAERPVRDALGGVLLRADGRLAYAVRDDIPVLLVDEGIWLDQLPGWDPSLVTG